MAEVLISVKNVEEAILASRYPIAILDVKEPSRGALGAAEPATLRQIAQAVDRSQTKSFSAGELSDWISGLDGIDPTSLVARYGADLIQEFRYVKIGLAGMRNCELWPQYWRDFFADLPTATSPVAVAYLDDLRGNSPLPTEVISLAASSERCSTILFDTYDKSNNLFSSVSRDELADLVDSATRKGIQVVVAGSVDGSCLSEVLSTCPNYVGVRGAVCRGGRDAQLDETRMGEWIASLQAPTKI